MPLKQTVRALVFTIAALGSTESRAYQFVPTDAEWQTWPSYCKAKYVWTNIGQDSKFTRMVNQVQKVELARWEDSGIRGVHHYCTGTLYLNRARLEQDSYRRRSFLHNALDETKYTFASSTRTSPLFAHVATQMAAIMYEQGEFGDAIDMLREVIVAQPANGVLYSAMAIMQRKSGQLEEAKSTLLRGYDAVDGKSAEINYNLGLISIELGEIDNAVKYAEAAYALGFPLPGLRSKLETMGRM